MSFDLVQKAHFLSQIANLDLLNYTFKPNLTKPMPQIIKAAISRNWIYWSRLILKALEELPYVKVTALVEVNTKNYRRKSKAREYPTHTTFRLIC